MRKSMYHREQIIYILHVLRNIKKESNNKYVRRLTKCSDNNDDDVIFRVGSASYKRGKTVTLLWKSTEPIQSCQEKMCWVRIKKQQQTTHKRSLTYSNWSSVLQKFQWLSGACGSARLRVFMWWIPAQQSPLRSWRGEKNQTSFWSRSKKERHHSWRYVPAVERDRRMLGDVTAILIWKFSSLKINK